MSLPIIDEGIGVLFANPDPDLARAFSRTKNCGQRNKVMSLKQAVAEFVHDGDYLATGGFGSNRTPLAACHEIVRQKKKNMAFAGHTTTHDFQVLCAGKTFNRVDCAYIVGLEARGLSPNARRYMESGAVEVTEWTNYALAARLKAGAMGASFIPVRSMMGTDTFKYSAAKLIECPFTGKKVVVLPALYPDVCVIHVHEADMYGNCRFRGISVADIELAGASKRVIITCERLIANEEIRHDPSATQIPFYLVDAVCEVPYGGYPGNMPYEYFSDEEHLNQWLTAEKDPELFAAFLEKNIYSCEDHFQYIEKNGGLHKLQALRAKEFLLKTGS
ncbi:MAG: CoA transferase subunit A [Candidatus Aminicenantes bacterium]|nr:CoA transferase subunit A [Candidatus Aminicenantes bacterium]